MHFTSFPSSCFPSNQHGYFSLGWVLPYLGMVGRFLGDDHFLGGFSIRLGPYFIPQHNPNDLLCRKNQFVSITFSSRDTRTYNWSIFHQNVLFNILGILYQFSPWYSIQVTSFSLILNLFDPSFSKNFRSDWVQFLFTCCEPSYRKKILCLCQTSWLKNRHFIVVIMSIYNTWCQITQWWGLVMTASHHSQFWHANQASSHLIALLWLQNHTVSLAQVCRNSNEYIYPCTSHY